MEPIKMELGKEEAAIRAEIEELGRLTEEQELILYNIALKQDELGRESTSLMLSRVKGNPVYDGMIEREYMTYQIFNHGNKGHEVACLYVTLKGLRYCMMFGDEIGRRRMFNPAGGKWTI